MHAILRTTGPEIVSGSFRDEAGISHPANVLALWTQAELATIGVYPVVDDPIPDGQTATSSTLTLDGDVVRRSWTLEPAPPPPVPASVTPRQMREALLSMALLDQVEALVAASDRATQIRWEYAVEFERTHPSWDAMGAMMDPPRTSAEIDDLFRLASSC